MINIENSHSATRSYKICLEKTFLLDKNSFWTQVEDLLRNKDWSELNLQGIGFLKRENLDDLYGINFLVHPEELIYAVQLPIEKLIQAKKDGMTTLHLAAREGLFEWAEVAVRFNDVNQKCLKGKTALDYSIEASSHSITHLLILYGADLQQSTPDAPSPLEIAVKIGNLVSVILLISAGFQDRDYRALKKAIENNCEEMIAYWIKKELGIYLDLEKGEVALHKAIKNKHTNAAKFLFENGAAIDSSIDSVTPLMCAAIAGDLEILKFLLEKGAAVNSCDKNGMTALHYAISHYNGHLVKTLLDYNADPLISHSKGLNAYHEAAAFDDDENLKLMWEKTGIEENFVSPGGRSLLHIAALHSCENTLKLLCSKFDVDQYDSNQQTPLIAAISHGQTSAVKLLLHFNADPLKGDKEGFNALSAAIQRGKDKILKILLQNCSDKEILSKIDPKDYISFFQDKNNEGIINLLDEYFPNFKEDNSSLLPCKTWDVEEIEPFPANIIPCKDEEIEFTNYLGCYDSMQVEHHISVVEVNVQNIDLLLEDDENLQNLNRFLEINPNAINAPIGETKEKPLEMATRLGLKKKIKFLIQNKADINIRDKERGNPPSYSSQIWT